MAARVSALGTSRSGGNICSLMSFSTRMWSFEVCATIANPSEWNGIYILFEIRSILRCFPRATQVLARFNAVAVRPIVKAMHRCMDWEILERTPMIEKAPRV